MSQIHLVPKPMVRTSIHCLEISSGPGAMKILTASESSEVSKAREPTARPALCPHGGRSLDHRHRAWVSRRERCHTQNPLFPYPAEEATQAAFPDAWETLAQRPYSGLRVKTKDPW